MVPKMIDRIKESFANMNLQVKAFLLYAYFAGMAFFIMAWLFGQGFFGIGVAIGFFSALIIEPLLETSEKGIKAREITTIFRFRFARCLLFSIGICYLIAWIRFVISYNLFNFYFEPFSFGFIYAVLHMLIITILRRLWRLVRRKE